MWKTINLVAKLTVCILFRSTLLFDLKTQRKYLLGMNLWLIQIFLLLLFFLFTSHR